MKKTFCWLIIFYSLFIPGYLFAHPHVFIDDTVIIVFDQDGMVGIKAKWVFDEMFSSMIIHDYDKNKDGIFDLAEIEETKKGAFSNLKKFNYFTHIKIDKKDFIVNYVENFSVCLDNNRVIYTFFIPCSILATPLYKEVKISMYDDTYYVDIARIDKNSIQFENISLIDYSYKIMENTKNPYYFGQIFPQEIVLKFRKRNE